MHTKLAVSLLVAALWATAAPAQNQITNWEFDQGIAPLSDRWFIWEGGNFTSPGLTVVENAGLSGRYAMKVDCGTGALDPLQFFRSFLLLEQGKTYYISFLAKADAPRPMSVGLEARSLYNWVTYWSADIQLTTEAKLYSFTYTHTGETVGGTGVFNNDIDLQFWLAGNGTDLYLDRVWMGTAPAPALILGGATSPVPGVAASDIPTDPTLSWTPGKYAATHNVYLGASADDVNNATAAQPLGVLVSQGQAQAAYKVAAALDYGKTYYWRVDEVNAAPSNTIYKGDVWSFTVEPYTYPITGVVATASSTDKATTGATNTVNGSGLTNDLASTASDTMWLTSMIATGPAWIQFQFDKVYKLSEMWVWNHNTEFEPLLGYGIKDVTIEYSVDGTTWTVLKDMQFTQASAAAGYAHNTTVDCGGIMAQYVRLTPKSNWSIVGLKQYGLSEVRFYYVPTQARAPQPKNAAREVALDASLDWRPGRDVTSQNVYFGTDKLAVANGTVAAQAVTTHGFDPGALDFGTTYFWKVDEVGAATYPGSLWSFTTQEYAAIDNFESYSDIAGSLIYEAWLDGTGGNGTGSMVGYMDATNGTFGETVIVHAGKQSMPFEYNNVSAPYYSEATRTFDDPQDWTVSGAANLSLYFRGYPALATVPVTESGGKINLTGSGTDIWNNSDEFTFAYKTLTGDGAIVARVVDKGTGSNTWAKGGVMIRDSLTGGSTFLAMVLSANSDGTASNGYSLQYRLTTDGGAASADGTPPEVKAPYWVKVQRAGDALTGYISADGKTWKQHGSAQTISMPSPVYIGLCVTSHAAGEQRTVQFDNIATTGGVGGSWQGVAIAGTRNNDPAPLYVTLEDKAGKKKTVVNPDAAATTAATWKQWKIALSDFTGVNLAAVKKITIGVGDLANPKPGATGMLYFDDLGFGKAAVVEVVNLAVNGGFETGVADPWWVGGGGGATATGAVVTDCAGADAPEGPLEGKYCLNVKVSGPSTNFWNCAFNTAGPTFTTGTKYTLSAFFKVKSGTGKINIKPEHVGGNWEGYGETQFTITDKWVEYHVTTPVFTSDVRPTSLTFHIGFQAQEFWVDNIQFYEGDYVPSN